MNIALWIVQVLLALMYVMAGSLKAFPSSIVMALPSNTSSPAETGFEIGVIT